MKIKIEILLVLVITLSVSCVGEDQEFGNTSCYNERSELLNNAYTQIDEALNFCNRCSPEECAESAFITATYLATLTRYKTDWRESEGGCSESELVQLESQIDDNMAYYREHYEDFLACS